jgi:methylenetetrahydrofolate reductase (NADPH)
VKDIPAPQGENQNISDLLITPTSAASTATSGLVSLSHKSKTEQGKGELNDAATWDDFPNGRFGDFKSPAFGNQGPWGGSGIAVGSLFDYTQIIHLLRMYSTPV